MGCRRSDGDYQYALGRWQSELTEAFAQTMTPGVSVDLHTLSILKVLGLALEVGESSWQLATIKGLLAEILRQDAEDYPGESDPEKRRWFWGELARIEAEAAVIEDLDFPGICANDP